MKKELFYSLEASTRTNHPSPAFQAHKRTRSLAEIRGARQPAPFAAEAPNKTRAPTGRKETPQKEAAAAAHTNDTGTYKGRARARRSSTRGDGVGDRPPREARRKSGDRGSIVADGCRFFASRAPRASVDVGSNGSGPSLGSREAPARRAHSAVVGVLHPPGCPISQITATTHAQEGAKPWRGSTSVAKSSTTPLYIHRRRPPRRYQTETEISCHVVAQMTPYDIELTR